MFPPIRAEFDQLIFQCCIDVIPRKTHIDNSVQSNNILGIWIQKDWLAELRCEIFWFVSPVLTEKDDKTISLSSILGFEILSEKLLMLGSVDGSLFQEEIENSHPGIFDANVCISSRMEPMMTSSFWKSSLGLEKKRTTDPPLLIPEPVIAFSLAR